MHRLGGHYWTLRAHLAAKVRRPPRPASVPWRTELVDPLLGPVPLSGRWCAGPDAERALILVHGLGGSADSAYLDSLQAAAHARGVSTLRLSLRGADLLGPDLYHAGLWQDIAAAAASPELARYRQLFIAGYSLGGHVALSYALHARDPRLAALVAVCPPLDLALSAQAFDRCATIYRQHVMSGLKAMFRAVTRAQRDGPWRGLRYSDVARIASVVEWDDRVIAPRHGFHSARDYYARTSVGPALAQVTCRTLIVSSEQDPMVPFATVAAILGPYSNATRRASHEDAPLSPLAVRRVARAGHLGFPAGLDLGFGSQPGLAAQLAHFLLAPASGVTFCPW